MDLWDAEDLSLNARCLVDGMMPYLAHACTAVPEFAYAYCESWQAEEDCWFVDTGSRQPRANAANHGANDEQPHDAECHE